MSCFRHSSEVSRPASDSFRIPTICSSRVPALLHPSPPRQAIAGLYYRRTLTSAGLNGRMQLKSKVLFRQLRPGLHGAPFTLFKFCTMNDVRDLDGVLLPQFK